ncbi:ATP-binding protein [Clostridium hydrogeniformans]|uniref:ATP-binding protein n=1 Tax=Clostridium hydrogeniformans TaxID=349933 RepID=UPI000480F93C|nr:ATP-binding protein [Clostridium hydrogeniformans]
MLEKFKKKEFIPWDKYFKLIKPNYIYLKIIPHKSIRNYNSSNIAKAITHTFRSINKRIKIEQKKLWFELNFKISYVIDIESDNASFYFIVPEVFQNILLEKISEIWTKATIERVECINPFAFDSTKYQLGYKKEDALSLQVDKKSNEPLNSILNVIEIMKDEDRVTIIYNFLPRTQFGWLKQYQDTMQKLKEHKPIEKEKMSFSYISKGLLSYVVDLLDTVMEVFNDFTGGTKQKENQQSFAEALATALEQEKELSNDTKKKKDIRVLDTQIVVVSSSKDKTREDNNALSVCQSYRVLDEDNELNYKKITSNISTKEYKFKNVDVNTISTDEAQNFIQIPGRQLLRDHRIKHINIEETQVPDKLQEGYFSLGEVKYKGSVSNSYLENEYNIGNLPLVLIGSQGSGKTTYMKNIARYCSNNGEGVFLIDFIKNCELSNDIAKVIPKDKLIVLNLAEEKDIQGLGFNEIKITDDMTSYKKMMLANLQSQQVMALVDSISVGDPLSSRMRRFLSAACNVVFVQGHSSIRNVIECLENHNKRKKYIESLPKLLTNLLEDDIDTLSELNEWSKATKNNPPEIIGTKESKIEHILDRISLLREDFKLKYMYNKNCSNNIDLVECMEQGKVVLIQMKESDFPTKMIKNILVTYWISKIWLTSQLRGSLKDRPLRCNVIADEIFQAPTCMKTLEYILPQSRKFGCKFIFSTQYIKQLESIFNTLEASGSSYMLLKGSMEDDFNHFKSKLENFEFEDLRDMQQFSSLNLIYYSSGYASFISKLPRPV